MKIWRFRKFSKLKQHEGYDGFFTEPSAMTIQVTLMASIHMDITTLFTFSLPPTARFAQNTLWQWTQTYEVPKLFLTLTTEGEFSDGEFNFFFKVLKVNRGWHAGKKILLCLKQFPCHYWKLFHGTYLSALELRSKSNAGDKSTQLAHQVFPGKTLALCLPQGDLHPQFQLNSFSDSLQCIHQVAMCPSPENCSHVIYTK